MVRQPRTRRSVLAATALTLAGGLAGCQDGGGETTTVPTPTEPQRTAPPMSFDFEYDPDAGMVTITHENGVAAEADTIHVQGEGFADAEGADMTGPGQWAGDVADDGMLRVGHAVTVGVTAAYHLRIVWRDPTADRAFTIDEHDGPDA